MGSGGRGRARRAGGRTFSSAPGGGGGGGGFSASAGPLGASAAEPGTPAAAGSGLRERRTRISPADNFFSPGSPPARAAPLTRGPGTPPLSAGRPLTSGRGAPRRPRSGRARSEPSNPSCPPVRPARRSGWRLLGMARGARPLAAGGGGGGAEPPERAGPWRPQGFPPGGARPSPVPRPGPEPSGPSAAPETPSGDTAGAGRRGGRLAAKLGPGRRGWWALLALQLHLLRALAQGSKLGWLESCIPICISQQQVTLTN
ncbi:hypothetical protein H8959_007502, partial [Pygathrix nigripes]